MTVTAPDVSVWWDETAVTAAALAVLRLQSGDVDAGRVAACVVPAGQEMNQFLDRVTPFTTATVPAQVAAAHVTVTVEWYRNPDGSPTGDTGDIMGSWRPGVADHLATVRRTLEPFRERRGVG